MLTIAAAGLFAGGAAALVVTRNPAPKDPALRSARNACSHVARFEQIVERNRSAAEASRELALALRFARLAAEADTRWLPLSGGIQTLQIALEKDDAGAANVGIRVVDAQCAPIR
jgi:hypothetical protein